MLGREGQHRSRGSPGHSQIPGVSSFNQLTLKDFGFGQPSLSQPREITQGTTNGPRAVGIPISHLVRSSIWNQALKEETQVLCASWHSSHT